MSNKNNKFNQTLKNYIDKTNKLRGENTKDHTKTKQGKEETDKTKTLQQPTHISQGDNKIFFIDTEPQNMHDIGSNYNDKLLKARNNSKQKPKPKQVIDKIKGVRIIPIGGLGKIGMNMYVVETEKDMVVIDVGQAISDETSTVLGAEADIPDFRYVLERKDKLKAILLTHGHDDHIGALYYLLEALKPLKNIDIYGGELTLIRALRLQDKKSNSGYKNLHFEGQSYNEILKVSQTSYNQNNYIKIHDGYVKKISSHIEIGFFHVNHSIEDAYGVVLNTPFGSIMYTGDFKVDLNPLYDKKIDFNKIKSMTRKKPLVLMSDSTNALKPGRATSERDVYESLEKIFKENKDKHIIVATFATSSHRIQSILSLAKKYNKNIQFAGGSMKNLMGPIYKKMGKYNNENTDSDNICMIVTGSQGEENSFMERVKDAVKEGGPESLNNLKSLVEYTINGNLENTHKIRYKDLTKKNTVFVVSANPIPGNEKSVQAVVDALRVNKFNVITNADTLTHASGHGYVEDLQDMYKNIKPDYFLPVHGEEVHQIAAAEIAKSLGIANYRILENGEYVTLYKGKLRKCIKSRRIPISGAIAHRKTKKIVFKNELMNMLKKIVDHDYIYFVLYGERGITVTSVKVNDIGSENIEEAIELMANQVFDGLLKKKSKQQAISDFEAEFKKKLSNFFSKDNDMSGNIILKQI